MAGSKPDRAGRAARATAGADVLEVKATVVERHEKRALEKLGLKRADGERRKIFFYDSRELDLYDNGVCLRARVTDGAACDTTVKIRPVEPKRVAGKWRKKSGFKVEADAIGSVRVVRSASFTLEQGSQEVDEVARGERSIDKLFSGEQETWLAEMSPVPVDFSKLVAFGPVAVLRWKVGHQGLPYELCIEEWRLPDGRDVIEVSIKVKAAEAAAAQAALGGFLEELGIATEARQQTKTRMALKYFAAQS